MAAPRSQPAPRTLRLTTPGEVIAATPLLIGFHPRESLVLVGLDVHGKRVVLTARVDLPGCPLSEEEQDQYFGQLLGALRRAEAHRVRLLVFTADPGREVRSSDLPHFEFVAALVDELQQSDFRVPEALCVIEQHGDQRWWSYLCRGVECCPPEGQVVEASTSLSIRAEFAVEGRFALADRDALVAMFAPDLDSDPGRRALFDALPHVMTKQLKSGGRGGGEGRRRHRWRRELAVAAQDILSTAADSIPVGALCAEREALLLIALGDRHLRDLLIGDVVRRGLETQTIEVLAPVLRHAPETMVAPVATVVAACAYAAGHGAAAWVAIDRALEDDPLYRLAGLLAYGLDNGLPPQSWRASLATMPPIESWDGVDLVVDAVPASATG